MKDLLTELIVINPEISELPDVFQQKVLDLYFQGEICVLALKARELISFIESEAREEERLRFQKELFETFTTCDLKIRYDKNVESLKATGILQDNNLGIPSIYGEAYPVPSYENILGVLSRKREVLQEKLCQGFFRLQLIPIATSIQALKDVYAGLLLKHKQDNKLFQAKDGIRDIPIPLDLDVTKPVYVYDGFIYGEIGESLIYYPQRFDPDNHEGYTKRELIEQLNSSPFPGWNVILLEDNPFLTKENKGKTIAVRKQLENNKTPIDYLNLIQTQKPYHHEYGLTIEDWLTCAIQRLHERNEAINIYEEWNVPYLIGNYITEGFVPYGYWSRDGRRAGVGDADPGVRRADSGALSAVRIV